MTTKVRKWLQIERRKRTLNDEEEIAAGKTPDDQPQTPNPKLQTVLYLCPHLNTAYQ